MQRSRFKMQTKQVLESVLWKAGLDVQIRRADAAFATRSERDLNWLQCIGPKTILDIGAHEGNVFALFRRAFPEAFIHCFEPVAEAYEILKAKMRDDGRASCHNFAVGDRDGTLTFHRSEATETSSALPMAQLHRSTYPHTAATSSINVPVRTLDGFMAGRALEVPMFVKIDVQGSELKVLEGGHKTIARADVVIVEASFVELYDGQPLFDDLYRAMQRLGLSYAGSFNQLIAPKTHQIYQQDAIFVNQSLAGKALDPRRQDSQREGS